MSFRVVQPNAENVFPIFEEFDLHIRIAILAAIIIASQILKLSIHLHEQINMAGGGHQIDSLHSQLCLQQFWQQARKEDRAGAVADQVKAHAPGQRRRRTEAIRFVAPGSSRATLRFILATSCMEYSQFESIDMAEYGLLAEQNDLSLSLRRKTCLSRG
jgi:hypothetical protein